MIVDPKVEAAIAQARAQQQPQLIVATPVNDIQLVVLAAAELYGYGYHAGTFMSVPEAVSNARQIFVEAVVREQEEPLAISIQKAFARLHPSEPSPAGQQFVLPGVK